MKPEFKKYIFPKKIIYYYNHLFDTVGNSPLTEIYRLRARTNLRFSGANRMALWHNIVIERIKLNGQERKIDDEWRVSSLTLTPKNHERYVFELDVSVFTGKKIKKKGWISVDEVDEVVKFSGGLAFSDVKIEILSNVETAQVVRNAGVSALAGAIIAGPLGAAAGGWLGSKVKNIQLKCEIPKFEISFLGSVASGFVEDYKKTAELITLNDEF